MTVRTGTVLKTYFETNDKPSQSQFSDFIDSSLLVLDNLSTINNPASARSNLGLGSLAIKSIVSSADLQTTGVSAGTYGSYI